MWTDSYTGEETASAYFTAQMSRHEGRLRIQIGDTNQTILLTPETEKTRRPSVVFRLPGYKSLLFQCCGATQAPPRFCSRQAWGRRVAYASQFLDPDNRAHRGKAKIKAKLIADLNSEEWELPPKPKWMRSRTYNRHVERFDRYEAILEDGIAEVMAKFLGK